LRCLSMFRDLGMFDVAANARGFPRISGAGGGGGGAMVVRGGAPSPVRRCHPAPG
jgi:hypothetical protein